MKVKTKLTLFFRTLVFNFGIVYLVLNIFSIFIELTAEPFGGFIGQSIFVIALTSFNFLMSSGEPDKE